MVSVINCKSSIAVQADALKWLADISDGDARIALGNLQLVLQFHETKSKVVTIEDIKEKIKVLKQNYQKLNLKQTIF